jgi:uncharacterized membrane protein SpoIIM required for sporulation
MIQSIGVMIGFYIITRMISFVTRKEQRAESTLVRVFSLITLVITVLVVISLFTSSVTAPQR